LEYFKILNQIFFKVQGFQSRNRECWTSGRKIAKSLKQEGFRTPSFPGCLLDHGLRNAGRRENLLTRLSRELSWGTAELERLLTIKYRNAPVFRLIRLIQRLLLSGVYEDNPIQDLCAQLNWMALRECFMFFVECGVKM
jgi:hypothetical protein